LKEERFRELISEAIDSLPEEFRSRLENVDITVESYPSRAVLKEGGTEGGALLGLYRGIPLDQRGTGYGGVLPDIITIYRKPIESICGSENEVKQKISEVLTHEIGHHFGMSEEELA
jgi:predicted Zn-dependent protease with MMP-like domain